MNASDLLQMAIELRERESLLDIAAIITMGRRSHILWLSRGDLKRKTKGCCAVAELRKGF